MPSGSPYLIFILALVTGTSYFFGRWIDEAVSQKNKLWLLWGGGICNASTLIATKVMALAGHAAPGALTSNAPPGTAAAGTYLSIGVSYYVFQAIFYLIDIYLEIDRAERHFGYFAVYLSFFPKLLQGPIERARSLLPQLKAPQKFEYQTVKSGLLLFAWGLMKQLVVADGLSQVVDTAYNNIGHYSGGALLFATYCYYMQIFFAFSGYTDMARGTARMLGIELSTNFNKPYLATSISDFWRRWHISRHAISARIPATCLPWRSNDDND